MANQGLLQRMTFITLAEPFDGLQVSARYFNRQNQTGADQLTIQHHAAGTASTRPATVLGPGQPQVVTQYLQQRVSAITPKRHHGAIEMDLDLLVHLFVHSTSAQLSRGGLLQ